MKSALFGAVLLALVVVSAGSAPALAQSSGPMAGEINAFPGDESETLIATLDAAQRDAVRPGDEALTCDQLGAEMTSVALDPQVQAVAESFGGDAASALAQLRRQRDQQMTTLAAYAAVVVLHQLATRVAGAGLITGAALDTLGASINARQNVMSAQTQAQAAQVTPIMPQLMRGNRLQALADAQSCAFLTAVAPQ